jgi:hypothetical protein
MARMKTKFFLALLGLTIAVTGCVGTVDGNKAGGLPLIKDKIEARYDRPADEVFVAAKDVIAHNGVLLTEGTLFGETNSVNQVAKTIFGRVDERRVWIRIEQIEPKITALTIQTRTKGGGSDLDLAAQLDKQIALKMVK